MLRDESGLQLPGLRVVLARPEMGGAGFWKTGNLENCASRDQDWGGGLTGGGAGGPEEGRGSGKLEFWGTGKLGN